MSRRDAGQIEAKLPKTSEMGRREVGAGWRDDADRPSPERGRECRIGGVPTAGGHGRLPVGKHDIVDRKLAKNDDGRDRRTDGQVVHLAVGSRADEQAEGVDPLVSRG